MKILLLIIAIPVVLLAAIRLEWTPWRLLSPSEVAAQQAVAAQVQTLQAEVEQLRKNPPQKISDGSWMQNSKRPSPLDRQGPGLPKR